jgi:hypothetical protein
MAATKKKASTGKILLISGGVLALGYGIYTLMQRRKAASGLDVPPGFDPGSIPDQTVNLIDTVDNAAVNVRPQLKPMGTPDGQLQYNILLKKGDRGAEVNKLQRISNVISKILKTKLLSVDGIFGNLTDAKLMAQFGRSEITLNQALKNMRAVQAWEKAGRPSGGWARFIQ